MPDAAPGPPSEAEPGSPGTPRSAPLTRRLIATEIACVLALSLGAAAVSATISFVGTVTAPGGLAEQTSNLIPARAEPDRPWLDLAWQMYALAVAMAPVALVVHLLHRGAQSTATIGFDIRRPGSDLARGALLASVIGVGGIVVYLVSWQLDLNTTVTPSALNSHWWELPVLLLQAVKNGVLEEVIVIGYLMLRTGQLGWSPAWAALVSSLLRATYHLYQGVGMFVGNLVMGLVFCWFYQRYGRVMPLVVAHTVIDVVAFVGSVYLLGRIEWLPG